MEKRGFDWVNNLVGLVGQSYDGAASMKGLYSGLQERIFFENPKALNVWCQDYRLNLIVLSTVGKTLINMLGEIKNQEGADDFKIDTECCRLKLYFQSSTFILTAFIFKCLF